MNAAVQKVIKPVDLQIYDCAKCFDSLWIEECMNDMFESGVTNDKLAMIYYGNRKNMISIPMRGMICALSQKLKFFK